MKKLFKSSQGTTAIEYAIIASLLSVFIIGGVSLVGQSNEDNYDDVAAKVSNAMETASGGKKDDTE